MNKRHVIIAALIIIVLGLLVILYGYSIYSPR